MFGLNYKKKLIFTILAVFLCLFLFPVEKSDAAFDPDSRITVSANKTSLTTGGKVVVTIHWDANIVTGDVNIVEERSEISLAIIKESDFQGGSLDNVYLQKKIYDIGPNSLYGSGAQTVEYTWDTAASGTTPGEYRATAKIYKRVTNSENTWTGIGNYSDKITVQAASNSGGDDDDGDDGDGGDGGGGGGSGSTPKTIKIIGGTIKDNTDLFNTIIFILKMMIYVAAAIGIIYGGILYIQSLGDATKTAAGKKAILYSIVGLVLAFFAQFILNAVMDIVGRIPT
ncbi:MAG: pilin [Patescibacteria group bacterium]|jgi:hypothetical protein